MAITNAEKELWKKLDENLKGVPNKYTGLDSLFEACDNVLSSMREIISGRKDLDNKTAGVGVRGMKDILSGQGAKCGCRSIFNFLGDTAKVNRENFSDFCECLRAISKLPRGSYPVLAWLWGRSALSKDTKRLCGEAKKALESGFGGLFGANKLKELLNVNLELGGEESKNSELYGTTGEWNKINDMPLSKIEDCIELVSAEITNIKKLKEEEVEKKSYLKKLLGKNLKLGGEESKKIKLYGVSGEWEKVDEMELVDVKGYIRYVESELGILKDRLISRLVKCYNDQGKHIVNSYVGTGTWPLVTDSGTIGNWKKKNAQYYAGEFSIKYSENEYRIYVYNQGCKDYGTGESFNGPNIVESLDEWCGGNRKNVIVVDGYENE